MTKQHLVALATELFDARPEANRDAIEQWNLDCRAVIRVCRMFNPRFDKDRFIEAITRGYPSRQNLDWRRISDNDHLD